jgi:hypothetical protein
MLRRHSMMPLLLRSVGQASVWEEEEVEEEDMTDRADAGDCQ